MMETQIQPIDMTPGPPFVRPREKLVVMPVPASVASYGLASEKTVQPHSSTAHR